MSTRNVTGAHVRQSMVSSGGAVKARQLVSLSKPCFEPSCLLLYPYSNIILEFHRLSLCYKTIVLIFPCSQQAQLNSQLAQLSSNLSDTENLLRMTSVQAEAMRGLGSWHGGL
jgi:hypothetical protein